LKGRLGGAIGGKANGSRLDRSNENVTKLVTKGRMGL